MSGAKEALSEILKETEGRLEKLDLQRDEFDRNKELLGGD